jgi:hypothetical protein
MGYFLSDVEEGVLVEVGLLGVDDESDFAGEVSVADFPLFAAFSELPDGADLDPLLA